MGDADPPPWWWQVLSGSSAEPYLARGTAADMPQARRLTEEAMESCPGSVLGTTVGPDGESAQCRRTRTGTWKWTPRPAAACPGIAPRPGTVYSVGTGRNTGQPADLDLSSHYPAEAFCACGMIIRIQARGGQWQHTGRAPGEP
jgi:hypothetical protein